MRRNDPVFNFAQHICVVMSYIIGPGHTFGIVMCLICKNNEQLKSFSSLKYPAKGNGYILTLTTTTQISTIVCYLSNNGLVLQQCNKLYYE